MKIIWYCSMMIFLICMMLLIILNFISKKMFMDREKNSPFECGFDPKNLARLPFSLQFFLVAVIFVIFDVELTLLLPIITVIKTSNLMNLTLVFMMFILILLLGLYHEQTQGALNWMK